MNLPDFRISRNMSLKGPIKTIAGVSFFFLLIFFLVPHSFGAESRDTPEYSQNESAYLVSNLEELNYIRQDLDNNYILVDHIDASSSLNWENGKGWNPIGDRDDTFKGSFDGNDYEIRNMIINRSQESFVGFFSVVEEEAKVTDTSLINVDVVGKGNVGGLAGYLAGEVVGSEVSGSVKGGRNVGGLVGYNASCLEGSSASSKVYGQKNVGGLVGKNGGSALVIRSFADETVEGKSNVGGLVGYNSGGMRGGSGAVVKESYAEGNVFGNQMIGGLVGTSFGIIEVSFARGDSVGKQYVGGLVGGIRPSSTVDDSYSTGSVEAENEVGGFAGYKNSSSDVSDSYWNKDSSGSEYSAAGVGLSDIEMRGRAVLDSMEGFNFDGVWDVISSGYPIISSLRGSGNDGSIGSLATDFVSYHLSSLASLLIF